ncbi:MAG: DUF3410 domain-containing protein, partial [Pseudomonadota bacterium]
DGKRRGTHMIFRALCQQLGLPARVSLDDLLPAPPLRRLVLGPGLAPEEALRLCIRGVHDVRRDHDHLLRESRRQGMAKGFDACRATYPLRREFATLEVVLTEEDEGLAALLSGAGFPVAAS